MSSNNNVNKSNSAKPTTQTSKVNPAGIAKIDERTATEFSNLLQRRGESEHGQLRDREISASVDEGRENAGIGRQGSVPMQAPDMFFQSSQLAHRPPIQEATDDAPKAATGSSSGTATAAAPAPVDVQSEQARPIAIDQIVETVYRDWQSQQASATGQKWSFQLSTGANVTSEMEIELTSSGEWRIRITDESKSEASTTDQQDGEEQLIQNWDHKQFCLELEACLREKRPDINFSAAQTT